MSLSSRDSGVSRWQMARSAADRMGLTAAKAGRKSYPAPLAHCRALSTMGSINRSPVMARVNPAGRGLGAGAAAADNDATGWLARGWGAPVVPVSYTHLRA